MIVYVAGKYRGKSINEVHDNIELARTHSVELWKQGYSVITPHLNTAYMDGVADDETFLQGDLEILSKCDAIYMLPNWKQSEGAKAEYKYAKERGIKCLN